MPVLIILLTVVVLIGAIMYSQHQTATMERHWQALAAERGLQWLPGGWFTNPQVLGEQDDYSVAVGIQMRSQGKSSVPYTTITARPRRPLPADLRITPEGFMDAMGKMLGGQDIQIGDAYLDQQLRFRSTDPEATKALFADPGLRQAIGALANGCSYSRLENGEIVLEKSGRVSAGVGAMLDDVLKMVAALDGARLTPWQAVSSRLGLSLSDDRRRASLTGTHRGRQVILSVSFEASRTVIDVPVTGLPPGLTITKGKKPDAIRLGDPVLDGMIAATGRDPDAIRELLRDDSLRGELLSVIHAWPGSQVVSRGVRLVMPGAAAKGLEARLEEATTLATSLSRRLEEQQKRRTAVRQVT